MVSEAPETRYLDDAPIELAPDGSTVRPLCRITGLASFAHFTLDPGQISKAVSHVTLGEIWYIISGTGQMWRRHNTSHTTVELRPGTCLTIPPGTAFQF